MWRSPEPRFDVASAICQGGRDYQEDAIVTDFPFGTDTGVVVLADGMGGHAAGDVASKIVVTEVYSELKFQSASFSQQESDIPTFMAMAASGANAAVRDHVKDHPEVRGMGATLVAMGCNISKKPRSKRSCISIAAGNPLKSRVTCWRQLRLWPTPIRTTSPSR